MDEDEFSDRLAMATEAECYKLLEQELTSSRRRGRVMKIYNRAAKLRRRREVKSLMDHTEKIPPEHLVERAMQKIRGERP